MALLPLPMLGGCVAAAIPVLASGVVAKRTVDTAKPVPVAQVAAARKAQPAPAAQFSGSPDTAPNLTERWFAATLFAADLAGQGASVLPDPAASEDDALVRGCADQPAAILIDLDPGDIAFQPANYDLAASPGLAQALTNARHRGVTVLWTSVLDENRADDVRAALARTGLDPQGRDTLLLTRDPAETKTHRRDVASAEWCITAIVGDRRGDFDIALDYLRDPDAGTPFDPLFGNGWFEMPPPIASTPIADAA